MTSDVFFLTSKAIIQMYIFLSFIVLNDGILFLYPILNRELQFFFFFRLYRNCFVSVARKTNLFVVIILSTLRNLSVSFSLSFELSSFLRIKSVLQFEQRTLLSLFPPSSFSPPPLSSLPTSFF